MKNMKIAMLILVLFIGASAQLDTNSQHYYMYIYFIHPNDQDVDGARIALSTDGITWRKVNDEKPVIVPVLTDEHKMRDPNTYFDSRTGIFHLVWTTGWKQKTIGYSTSKDLLNWSPQLEIPVGESINGCYLCWAPELFYDDIKDSIMVYWSTDRRIRGKEAFYCMTKDFKSYTLPTVYFNPGYTVIDETIMKVDEGKYYMFFKDERVRFIDTDNPTLNIHYVYGPTPQGPWSPGPVEVDGVSQYISNVGCEGPTAIKIGSYYCVYFDFFNQFANTYRMVRTQDLNTTTFPWERGPTLKLLSDDVTIVGDFSLSHGSVSEIPRTKWMYLYYKSFHDKEVPDTTTYEPWTPPVQTEISVAKPAVQAGEIPLGKRNTGCGTGVGLGFFPPIAFRALSLRRRKRKKEAKKS